MPSSALRATRDGMGEWPDGLRFSFSDREQEKKKTVVERRGGKIVRLLLVLCEKTLPLFSVRVTDPFRTERS